ncbi:hypothetical protein [Microbacterium sp. H83]|uniref:hypothetical protein n=1 Tax=Microbacterium sp. H83 TaxID=1827324 RepID=UPI000AE63137|nr:hypothetical protein [Microbacterium sp. H83]
MSMVQETRIDGLPDDIETIAIFLKNKVAGAAENLSSDLSSARTATVDGWTGSGAEAFADTATTATTSVTTYGTEAAGVGRSVLVLADALRDAQSRMAGARAIATDAGLTVSGTQVHRPGSAPVREYEADAPGTETASSVAATASHAAQVQTWNTVVSEAEAANTQWQDALDTFATAWAASGANMLTVLTGLLTGAITGGALANAAFRLTSTKVTNAERLASLTKSLDSVGTPSGAINGPKSNFYSLLDEADDVTRLLSKTEDLLAGGEKGLMGTLRAGAAISKGLLVLGVAGTGYAIYDDIANGGESWQQAAASNIGGMAAGIGAGAGTGAIIGSFIVPPAGTTVGAAAGAVVGGVVGVFTSGMIDGMFEGAGNVLESGWNELVDTGEAMGDATGAVGDAVGGAWNSIFG